MRFVTVFLIVLAAAMAATTYTTKYDNVDLDEILANERLYKKYYDCLMSKGNCTPDGKELKNNLPDAIATDCTKCSEKQKEGSKKVLQYIMKNKKADYDELEKVYDPAGTYRKKHPLN